MIERSALLAPETTPRHVAIVMDGIRTWCAAEGVPLAHGHRRSAAAIEAIVADALALGFQALTLFAAPGEGWDEDSGIDVFARLAHFRDRVRLRVAGRRERVTPILSELERATAGCDGPVLTVAIDYSARRDVADAVRSLACDVAAGRLAPDAIDDARIAAALTTAGLPDPDLFIRTGGGIRLADTLLYECAYTELWATPAGWPDFGVVSMRDAIAAYAKRNRRFGR